MEIDTNRSAARFQSIGFLLLMALLAVPVNPQGNDRPSELEKASQLNGQVTQLYKEGRYREALPIAEQVLEIRQRLLASDDPSLGSALFNLAMLYLSAKREGEAEKMFTRALPVYEAHPEQNGREIATTLERLAYLRFLKQDYDRAEPLYLRSLQIQEQEFGAASPQTIAAMKNYACIDLFRGGTKGGLANKDADEKTVALKSRAMCWLGGLKDDCVQQPHFKAQQVLNGNAVKLATPPYPVAARLKHLGGIAFVAVLIDEGGNVIKAKTVCGGYPELNAAGLQAAEASKFTPTEVDGRPVQVTGMIIYRFVAQ
jgi:TonB family protein